MKAMFFTMLILFLGMAFLESKEPTVIDLRTDKRPYQIKNCLERYATFEEVMKNCPWERKELE